MTIWVVSGYAGSGKTTLARAICRAADLPYCHLGSVLLYELRKGRVAVSRRRTVGPLFLETFGRDRYLECVMLAARGPVVLDGLRLSDPVDPLREAADCKVVFRVESPDHASRADDNPSDFTEDLQRVRGMSDIIVPWLNSPYDVEEFARKAAAV